MPTPAQNRAKTKYRAKAYDQINLQVPKGKREQYKTQAVAHGLSLNAYIVALLDADAARASSGADAARASSGADAAERALD